MKTEGAVLVETGHPLEIANLTTPSLGHGQVLVEIAYSGICHTQVQEIRGQRGPDRYLPHCLGHEGSGTVLEIAEGVSKVKPGQNVALSWVKSAGIDAGGAQYDWNGRTVNSGPVVTFSRHAVISENRLIQIPDLVPLRDAVLLGCAAPTAFGAIINTARPQKGQSLAVFGCGGIGLCAIAAAVAAGCNPVIAVDLLDGKLEMAKSMGATHIVNANDPDFPALIADICPGGLDFAVESSGQTEVMAAALAAVRTFGGTAVIVGNPKFGEQLVLDPWQIIMGKRLVGAWSGDDDFDRDLPAFVEMILSENFDADVLLSKPYALTSINDAVDDLEAGRVGRPLIDMSLQEGM